MQNANALIHPKMFQMLFGGWALPRITGGEVKRSPELLDMAGERWELRKG